MGDQSLNGWMMNRLGNDRQLAYFSVRVALGFNLFFHGVVRFGDHYSAFVKETVDSFQPVPIPTFLVSAFAGVLPVLEFAIGLLLILGLWTREAALAGVFKMILLITGMCLLEEWDVVGVQMVYVLFYALVLAFREYNGLSIDQKRLRSL
jgi:thiosulfate dehydrogenase [quinone] large subunit